LSGVLVLTVGVDNDLETVVGLVILKIGFWSPGIRTGILEALDNWVEWKDVRRWSTEKNDRDGTGFGRIPGNLVRLSNRDDVTTVWGENWVGGRVKGSWSSGSQCRGRDGEETSKDGAEGMHFYIVLSCLGRLELYWQKMSAKICSLCKRMDDDY